MRADSATMHGLRRSLAPPFVIALLLAASVLASAAPQNTNANTSTNSNTSTNTNTTNGNSNKSTNTNTGTNTNTSTGADAGPAKAPVPCPSPQDYAQVAVTEAYRLTKEGKKETTVQLGDEITVEVSQLKTLLERSQCSNPNKNILLFLDGRPVKDATPFPQTDPANNKLKFQLKRTENSRDIWTYILGESKWTPRETAVSVGLEDEYAVNATGVKLNFIIIPVGWFFFWAVIFVLLLIAFWLLAWKTELLRDSTPPPGGSDRRPYSLARTQAAWWFFIVLASYLFIGMITGDFSTTITTTVLGLLGISAGTMVSSAFVDAGGTTPPTGGASATGGAGGAAGGGAAAGQPAGGAAAVGGGGAPAAGGVGGGGGTPAAGQAAAPYIPKNTWWWLDILSDPDGLSFHRFQMAAWTLVLGIIFIIKVWGLLAMPDFNGSLLALLGISAGTYLGLKIPEATKPTTPTS